MPESGELNQTQLEQAIKSESPQQAKSLQALEQEKITGDEQPAQNFTPLKTPVLYGEGRPDPQRPTKDFVQKHGSLTRRREKKHTGRGLHPQHEEDRSDKAQTVEAKERLNQFALKEALTEGVQDYEEGDDVRFDEFSASDIIEVDDIRREFRSFFESLDSRRSRDPSLVEKYSGTDNKIDRLKLLSRMHIADAALAVISSEEPGSRYLLRKLDFYKDLLEGKATRKRQQYDYDKREYVEVEEPIPAEEISPENVATGLMRNILYAEMKGTPELAAFNIAMRIAKDQSGPTDIHERQRWTAHMPDLFGYHSHIFYGREGIGHYGALADIYNDALRMASRDEKVESTPEAIEHRAVMLAAEWYIKAMEYNDPGRSQHSPYSSLKRGVDRGLKESIAWARLGEPVQRQLRGMRQKIQGVDLHNIGRFIGKAGDDKYGRELRTIHLELEHVPYGQEQEEWALKRNFHDIARVDKQHRKKQEAVKLRLERKKLDIEDLELPDEERTLQIQSVKTRYEEELRKLDEEYQVESQRVRTRTPEQLIEELKARQEALKPKHERHKSLAEKALDLHFRFNHHPPSRDDDNSGYYDQYGGNIQIDWINNAPLGLIKRAHRMLERGVSEGTVLKYAAAEIISGENGVDRAALEYVENKLNTIDALKKVLQRKSEVAQSIFLNSSPYDWNDPNYQKAQNAVQQVQSAIYARVNTFNSMLTDRTTSPSVSFEEDGLSPEAIQIWSELVEERDVDIEVLAQVLQAGFVVDEIKQYPHLLSPLISEMSQQPQYEPQYA